MAQLNLEVVTPERIVFADTVESVVVQGADGRIGILAQHAPLVAGLGIGPLEFGSFQGKKRLVAVSGGFVEVSHNKVTVLADTAELAEEIDVARARAARGRAERRLRERTAGTNFARAQVALRRAASRIRVAEKA